MCGLVYLTSSCHCLYPVRFRYLGLRVTGDWNFKGALFHPSAFGLSFRATESGACYRAEYGSRAETRMPNKKAA